PPRRSVTGRPRSSSTDSRRSLSGFASVTVTFAPCRTRNRVTPTPPPKRPRPITVTRRPSSFGVSAIRGRAIGLLLLGILGFLAELRRALLDLAEFLVGNVGLHQAIGVFRPALEGEGNEDVGDEVEREILPPGGIER